MDFTISDDVITFNVSGFYVYSVRWGGLLSLSK